MDGRDDTLERGEMVWSAKHKRALIISLTISYHLNRFPHHLSSGTSIDML